MSDEEATGTPWVDVVRAEQIDASASTIERYARSTIPWTTTPSCVLYPESTDDVVAITKLATAKGLPIYPISRGRNWGYGDACAPSDGMAIVDLGRMNTILEVDETLAYTVVEPGVTQGQLFERLQGSGLWMDATGAGPDASVVGNALERGFGHTRYGDHVQTICGLEIVLPTGEVVHTGMTRFEDAKAARAYPYGLGPDLTGLFVQSNLGIVTKMGLWLMPEPEAFAFFYATVDDDAGLVDVIEALRPLRLAGQLRSTVHIANDIRLFSARGQYPFEAANDESPLPGDLRQRMRRNLTAGAWNLSGSLTGTRETVGAEEKVLTRSLARVARVRYIDDRKLGIFETIAGSLPGPLGKNAQDQVRVLNPNYGLLKGIPSVETLRGAHWRARTGDMTGDPIEERRGCLWVSPVMPMRGEDAKRVASLASKKLSDAGFDLLMTFTLINERAMIAIIQIAFDAESEEESSRAKAAYEALNDGLQDAGYYPYRTSPMAMERYASPDDPFNTATQRIKSALDPKGILSPGRYIPR